jgi:hypothetical protein
MRAMIEGYIRAVEHNIAQYMLIEDVEDRQRALDAAYGMLDDFYAVLQNLPVDIVEQIS